MPFVVGSALMSAAYSDNVCWDTLKSVDAWRHQSPLMVVVAVRQFMRSSRLIDWLLHAGGILTTGSRRLLKDGTHTMHTALVLAAIPRGVAVVAGRQNPHSCMDAQRLTQRRARAGMHSRPFATGEYVS